MDDKKRRRRVIGIVLFLMVMLLFSVSLVRAQMTSQHFHIPASSVNCGGGQQGSTNFGIQNSVGQPTPPGMAQSTNFGLSAGLQSCIVEELFPTAGQRGDVDNDGNINVLDILDALCSSELGSAPRSVFSSQVSDQFQSTDTLSEP